MRKLYRRLSLAAVLLLAIATVVQAQERAVTGKVTDENGSGMPGVNVLLKGTGTGTATDVDGNFRINVPGDDAVLVVTFVGYATSENVVGARTVVNVQLNPDVQTLQELVVTGYVAEKKADIIGSVAVVDSKELLSTPAANLTTQLQGRAAGVVVSSSGEPGAAARVRIRGFSSFGNNDPLYIIDGVPTEDPSKLNPQDIESMQILKDATSASIYGSRAANGVIIITTKRGKSGTSRIAYDGYVGVQKIPDSTIPSMLNTEQYAHYLNLTNTPTTSHPVFGNLGAPTVPDYIVVDTKGFKGGTTADSPEADPSRYSIADYGNIHQILKTSPGTNWFKSVIQPGIIQSHQISASGGTDKGTYSLGFNYFNQEGAFKYTGFKRYTARANTMFNPKEFLRVGENLQVSYEDRQGNDNKGEGGAWAMSYRMVPYIPVYDINGGWGGNGVGSSGNGSNPLANLYRGKDNTNVAYKIFGNVFAEADLFKGLTFRTSFGVDYATTRAVFYTYRTYERSENIGSSQLTDQNFYTLSWTWTNTLNYAKTVGDHGFKLLLGSEAIKNLGGGIGVNTQNFDIEDPRLMNLGTAHFSTPVVYNQNMDPDGSTADAYGNAGTAFDYYRTSLASLFGRVDYQFKDRYLFNATVRRDGSSKFGSDNRYAVFPAFGLGWRISDETFMQQFSGFLSDLKIRGGWGQMGSQKNVPNTNAYTLFESNASTSNYDISGSNNNLAVGFRARQAGSAATKWETTETVNIGLDGSLFDGKWDVSFNWFNNKTKDLLVQRQRNGLESLVTQPYINIGEMQNKGIDLVLTNRGNITSDLRYEASLTFTHYKNEVTKLDASGGGTFDINLDRLSQGLRTQAGHPISSFYGYQIDGIYQSEAEVTGGPTQAGAVVGSWKYKDNSGNGSIGDEDKTFIGSPHPKFQTGLNASLRYKNFDLSAFFFWNYGNKIFNYTKYYTDIRAFVGGVSTRVLDNEWTPNHTSGTMPMLGSGAAGSPNGYTPLTTSTSNSFYVESGSYLRLRNLQIGYTMPKSLASRFKLENLRIYVQGQNLFTVTDYSGPDPDLSIQSGNGRDLYMGVDRSGFPNTRQYLVGLNITL